MTNETLIAFQATLEKLDREEIANLIQKLMDEEGQLHEQIQLAHARLIKT